MSTLLASFAMLSLASHFPALAATVTIKPGDNIQQKVDANPEGTIFNISAGTYTNQSVTPKNLNQFIGQGTVVLDGGGSTEYAFEGVSGTRRSEGVVIKNLTVQNYKSPIQRGAIEAYRNWLIENVVAQKNSGAGISVGRADDVIGDGTVIRNSKMLSNGQLGLRTTGTNLTIEGNEIAYNNTANHNAYWEAGATKFSDLRISDASIVRKSSDQLVIRNNHVHHNKGYGLWTDIENNNVLMEYNTVEYNDANGIAHEISYKATIRRNLVRYNGQTGNPGWMFGAEILVQNSQNVEVTENEVYVSKTAGDGIALIDQSRGGPDQTFVNKRFPNMNLTQKWPLKNVNVHHNYIKYECTANNDNCQTGGVSDWSGTLYSGNNVFNHNVYIVPSTSGTYWKWGSNKNWDGFKASGMEANGTATSNQSQAKPFNGATGIYSNAGNTGSSLSSAGGSVAVPATPTPKPVATATPAPVAATAQPSAAPTNTPVPTSTPTPAPAQNIIFIQAEDFDEGGMNATYFDKSKGNIGKAYRQTDVDIKKSNQEAVIVGWFEKDEWLHYTVNAPQGGNYVLTLKIGAVDPQRRLWLWRGKDLLTNVSVPRLVNWGSPLQEKRTTVRLNAGKQVVRLQASANFIDVDWMRFQSAESLKCLSADVNLDGVVNYTDYAYISKNLYKTPNPILSDVNADGKVNLSDVAMFSSQLFKRQPAGCI